jgi:hypothetical protein
MDGHGISINQGIEGAPFVFSDTTDPRFSLIYNAVVSAKMALNPVVFQLIIKASLFHHGIIIF